MRRRVAITGQPDARSSWDSSAFITGPIVAASALSVIFATLYTGYAGLTLTGLALALARVSLRANTKAGGAVTFGYGVAATLILLRFHLVTPGLAVPAFAAAAPLLALSLWDTTNKGARH